MFNIITRQTIVVYSAKYPTAKTGLELWYHEFKLHAFSNFNELKAVYRSASIIADNRVIFNIKGNDFRLVVKINFAANAAYVIWFGTHKEYDQIDARTVKFKR